MGRGAENAPPQAQEQAETGGPARPPWASSRINSHGRGERRRSGAAQAMRALRPKSVANARPGDYGRRAATPSGDGNAGGEGACHRVSISQRALWRLWKDHAGAAAGGDRRALWAALDGADRLLDGGLWSAACPGGWWKPCWPMGWASRSVWGVPKRLGRKSAR